MLFHSLTFIVFFTAVCFAYFLMPRRRQWLILLVSSYFFYACWDIAYLLILATSTGIVYGAALLMRRYQAHDKPILFLAVLANLLLLLVFKYTGFINANIQALLRYAASTFTTPDLKLLMPIGISFYIFKSVSYIIDVYRKEIEPERHIGIFALYVSFFPQILAGPIERSSTLLPQFKREHGYDYRRIADGLALMAWGFFKKLVIADRLAMYVNKAYADPAGAGGMPLLLAAYFFTIQIYCDFSGYSDIAIGSAQILGYEGMDNFKRPYFSKSMQEFWGRWHISLSTWFRDYLYIPMGGNRVSAARRYFNIMTVFLLSGLWHGANWTFVAWGGIHGVFLVAGYVTKTARLKLKQKISGIPGIGKVIGGAAGSAWSIIIAFNLAAFAWIFFKADSLAQSAAILRNMAAGKTGNILMGFTQREFFLMVISIVMLSLFDVIQELRQSRHPFVQKRGFTRWALYYLVILSIVFFGIFEQSKFIYFNF